MERHVRETSTGADAPRYLTRLELAALSGLSPSTVQRLKQENRIPFFQPRGAGGRVLFPRDAIEAARDVAAAELTAAPNTADAAPTDANHDAKAPKLPGPRPRWQRPATRNQG